MDTFLEHLRGIINLKLIETANLTWIKKLINLIQQNDLCGCNFLM